MSPRGFAFQNFLGGTMSPYSGVQQSAYMSGSNQIFPGNIKSNWFGGEAGPGAGQSSANALAQAAGMIEVSPGVWGWPEGSPNASPVAPAAAPYSSYLKKAGIKLLGK